ncbi:hypothetical protein PVAG01_10751 [Phlyctema vagabunda]|uniref:PAC domain-containing protein n=1 Tax=Phlyctema vagabunda TaxID=108571 RepID=A0ABR4P3T2_9HELO
MIASYVEPHSRRSSPTIHSPRLSLIPNPPPLTISGPDLAMDETSSSEGSLKRQSEAPDADEAAFFDLQPPQSLASNVNIENQVKRLFSVEHLHFILGDHTIFPRFSAFLNRYRPYLVPTLVRYLEMRKVAKAIEYANAVARKIRWPSQSDHYKFSSLGAASTNTRFDDFASKELLLLANEALPAFCTYTLIDTVVDCVARDITGQGIPVFRELVGELAEVFCLTDPSKHDNPIIYASEEFHKTTQYGTTYAIDRNCRFLQGPGTDKNCTLRLAQAIARGEESMETVLNYRRDGSPFVNLLMCAPLHDDKGILRYFIGAQVDVTGLVEEGRGIESFRALLHKDDQERVAELATSKSSTDKKGSWYTNRSQEPLDRLQELSSMFSQEESEMVLKNSRCADSFADTASTESNGISMSVKNRNQSKRIIDGEPMPADIGSSLSQLNLGNGARSSSLPGVYRHYLLVRPYPSLQIIFVSPSLRLPGILRTHLFSKLGGPTQTMAALEDAFRDGASVTAKVLWLPKNSQTHDRGRGLAEVKPKFIRCTPLLGSDDRVGVWMVILVPVDTEGAYGGPRGLEVIDDMAAERRRMGLMSASRSVSRLPSRAGSRGGESINGDYDGGFGLRGKTSYRTLNLTGTRGPADDDSYLYAEYLRGSSSTGGSREEVAARRARRDTPMSGI